MKNIYFQPEPPTVTLKRKNQFFVFSEECKTLCVSRGINRVMVPLIAIVTLGTIQPEDSGAAFEKKGPW